MPQDTRWMERRRRVWFAVKYVPLDLRPMLGVKLSRTLGTGDLTEALKRRHGMLAEFQKRIDDATAAKADAARRPPLSPFEAQADGWREALSAHAQGDGPVDDEGIPTIDLMSLMAEEAEAIAAKHGAAAAAPFALVMRGETPLLQHVPAWLREGGQKGSYKGRTKIMHERNVEALKTWLAGKRLAPAIEVVNRKVAGRYVTETLVPSGRDPKTINCRLSSLRAYWTFLAKRGLVPDDARNPWAGQSIAKGAGKGLSGNGERAFEDAEMVRLLSGPAKPELADLMMVAALSGMRLEEIYSLRVRDCSGDVFNVKQGKSAAAVRRVPMHSGLSGIVAARVTGKAQADFLFHEAGPAQDGKERSAAASKRFATYRKLPAVAVDETAEGKRRSLVNFHSFRRWFITAALRAQQSDGVVGQVVGHKPQGMTRGVYFAGDLPATLNACVEAVRLPAGTR